MIVLDASIVIKWFIQEEDSFLALKFKNSLVEGEESIVVPDLLFYEIINALRFKRDVSEQVILAIIPVLFDIGLDVILPHRQLMKEAFHLSSVTGLSVYDSVYLALANEVGQALITADRKILQQAQPFAKVKPLS